MSSGDTETVERALPVRHRPHRSMTRNPEEMEARAREIERRSQEIAEKLEEERAELRQLVRVQSSRRRRRASLVVMHSPTQQEAQRRWKTIGSAIRTASDFQDLLDDKLEPGSKYRAQDTPPKPKDPVCCCNCGRGRVVPAADSDSAVQMGADEASEEQMHVSIQNCTGWMLHPRSDVKRTWDTVIFGLLTYCAFYVPYRIGFDLQPEGLVLGWEIAIDAAFIIDIFLTFRTGYPVDDFDEDSRIEMRPKAVARYYVRGWFWIDLVAAFPTQLIWTGDKGAANRLPRLLRLPRMLRMMRLIQLLRFTRLFRHRSSGGHVGFVSQVLELFGMPTAVGRMLRLIVLTVTLAHLVSCAWFFMHTYQSWGEGDELVVPGQLTWWWKFCGHTEWWADLSDGQRSEYLASGNQALVERGLAEPDRCTKNLAWRYLISLYWATTTLTTMGYGDIVPVTKPEMVFTVVMMLLGVSFYAYIASTFLMLLRSIDAANSFRIENMEKLVEFTGRRGVSNELAKRLRKYFHHYWKQHAHTLHKSGRKEKDVGDPGDFEIDFDDIGILGAGGGSDSDSDGDGAVLSRMGWRAEISNTRGQGSPLADNSHAGGFGKKNSSSNKFTRTATSNNGDLFSDSDVVASITLPGLRADVTDELFREITRSVPFLHGKEMGFVELVAPQMEFVQLEKGQLVIQEGDRGKDAGLFFVLTGTVEAEFEADDSTRHVLARYTAGELFGETAMFDVTRHITSFRVAEEVTLYSLSQSALMAAIKTEDSLDVHEELSTLGSARIKQTYKKIAKIQEVHKAGAKSVSIATSVSVSETAMSPALQQPDALAETDIETETEPK